MIESFIVLGICLVTLIGLYLKFLSSRKLYEDLLVESKRKEAQISYLIETAQLLSSALSKSKLLRFIVEIFGELSKTERNPSISFLYLLDYNTNFYQYETGFNMDVTMLQSPAIDTENEFIKALKKEKSALYFDEIYKLPLKFFKEDKLRYLGEARYFISAPLFVEMEMMGFINIFCDESSFKYLKKEQNLLTAITAESAIALGSAVQSELAVLDRLTRIYNHAYFETRLTQEVARSDRYKYPVSLLMIDIDHFKNINDTYGHQVGDIVLKQVAQLIKRSIRAVDLLARYGGEEFSVILPETSLGEESSEESKDLKETGGALYKAEEIRKTISNFKFNVHGKLLGVEVSIGIGVKSYPEGEKITKDDLIRIADKALYKAKQEGRNRVAC